MRVNLDPFLRQERIDKVTGVSKFNSRLKGLSSKRYEKELIANGAKWGPIKKKEGSFRGIGNSSQWRLIIESLSRRNFNFPIEGVPFSALLTIRDESETAAVFSEMRHELQASGVVIADIRTALSTRIRP